MFAAILDTNVLWPSLQRDFLLSLAVEGLYRPLWSDHILAELRACEVEKLTSSGLPEDEAGRRAAWVEAEMRRVFDDALVIGYEPLMGTFGLPDPMDEHVVAAAVVGGAGAIVTENIKHFPEAALPRSLHVVHPASFAASTVEVDPFRAAKAVEAICARSGMKGPRLASDRVLEELETRYSMTDVRTYLTEILTPEPPIGPLAGRLRLEEEQP